MRKLALLIPVNKNKQVLLQHRDSGAPIKPNHWAFFGGHIESEETPDAAAIREFKEELQIDIKGIIVFFGRYIFDEEWGKVDKNFYIVEIDEKQEYLKTLQLEGDDLGYFYHADLDNLKISDIDRIVLDHVHHHKVFN